MVNRVLLGIVGTLVISMPARAGWDEGVAAFKAKNFAQAAREFEAVVADRPDWAGGYLMLGRTQLLLNRHADAVTTLRKGYDLNPSDLQTQLYLAQAYLAGQRSSEASQLLGKINSAGLPKEQQAFYQQLYAKALADSGQSGRAASALQKAAAASPDDADLQYQYGAMALSANNTDEAVSALSKAARLAPIRQAREMGGSGKDGIYSRAAEAARGLAGRQPTYDNLLLLGEAQLGAKQYEAAAGSFGQASSKNAGDWLPHYYAGQARTAQERYNEAESALKKSLSLASRSQDKSKVWSQLGFVYEKQKSFDQAKQAYQNAGDSRSLERVIKNEEIARNNAQADAEAEALAELQKKQRELQEQIKSQGGPPPLD
jgi:tetratricopeptide (TPR) repeat protein